MRTHLSEAEAIVAWLQTPLDERCPLPPKEQALLELVRSGAAEAEALRSALAVSVSRRSPA